MRDVRRVIARHVASHGEPGSAKLNQTRAEQRTNAELPKNHRIAQLLVARLAELPQDEGHPEAAELVRALSQDEAVRINGPASFPVPKPLATKMMRCLEAPLGTLVDHGIVPSSEAMARALLFESEVRALSVGYESNCCAILATSALAVASCSNKLEAAKPYSELGSP